MVPEKLQRWPSTTARKSLAGRFGLPYDPRMQDWEWEVADPSRIPEFLAAYQDSGLTDEEVSRCHYLIHLPTDPQYPALNLAQAAAITLYELRCTWLRQTPTASANTPAPFEMQEQMFARLREGLEAIHFLYGDKADALMHGIRHLLGRAGLTEMEVKLVMGVARQMRWIGRKD